MTEPTPDPDGVIHVDTAEVSTPLETSPDPEPADDPSPDETPADMAVVRKLRNEAKTLRHQLREEQAGRESDLARLAAYEKREVERAAAEVLVDPTDIWLHTDQATQQEFNDEFGSIAGAKVQAAARAIAEQRPHLARTVPPPSRQPIEGLRSGAAPEKHEKPVDWASALRGTGI